MINPITVFKCLSDETRLRCVALLHNQGKLCVCELSHALDLLQPKISRHLALLRQSGLLQDSREGQWVYYQINPQLPEWVSEMLDIAVKTYNKDNKQQKDTERLLIMTDRPDLNDCCK